MQNVEEGRKTRVETKLTKDSENGTREIANLKPSNKMLEESRGNHIEVLNEQYSTMREETLSSLNLLNSSGSAMLSALEMIPPPPDSGRTLGDYSARMMRDLSKGICEVVRTKIGVINQMHSIARDE